MSLRTMREAGINFDKNPLALHPERIVFPSGKRAPTSQPPPLAFSLAA
ncbi:MAG: hypothetical protein ACJ74Y_16720 [Bryobacteraceae bacterium]